MWGIILCDYARRYLRVGIRVDDEGIKARLYYRSIAIRWDEVVSLIKGDCVAPMAFAGMPVALDAGTIYWVYSRRREDLVQQRPCGWGSSSRSLPRERA